MSDQVTESQDNGVAEAANQPAEASAPEQDNVTEIQQDPANSAELQARLTAAEDKAQDSWDQLLRAKAELDNVKKRAERDLQNAHKYGIEKLATELLAVRDSMELGLRAADHDKSDIENLREGIELTLKMMTQVMEKFAIKEVDPVEQKFNPELHQAMAAQESDKLEPNTVISVMQKGYTLNDRLLRPALVTVSKAVAK